MARGRAVGITRKSCQPSLHGDYLKQAHVESADEESVEQIQNDLPEDVTGLPISSDEDDSGGNLSDDAASHSPPTIKSRGTQTENHAKSPSPPPIQFLVPPSAIPRKTFHSGSSLGSSPIALSNPKKRNSNMTEGDTEDELPDSFRSRKQPKKQYGGHRNKQSFANEKRASDTDGKYLAAMKGCPTFRKPKGSIVVSKVEQIGIKEEKELFKNPLKYMSNVAGKSMPQKDEQKERFLQPLVLLDKTPNTRSTRANKFKKPEAIETKRQEPTRAKFRQPELHAPLPKSSIATSSLTPLFNDAVSSSSFSSAPDSPEISTLVKDFELERSNISYDPGTSIMAKCPVCNEAVECSLLEEFDNGAQFQVRQQMRFCKAHRARTAQSQWDARGYPKIDWENFDSRLAQYHGALDDVLKGRRQSYYRNAMRDHLKSGRNRTLQQCLISGSRMEGLELGYYGSRGGKLMMENIICHFSHKIRRRAASDSLVSTGGVSAFVQAVLTPELAVMLVKEDMKTDDEGARAVLRDSAEVGHLLNEEEDEVIQDPESENEFGVEKVMVIDDDENNDIHDVVEEESLKIQRKREKRLQQQQEPDKVNKQEQAARTQSLLDEIFGKLSEDEYGSYDDVVEEESLEIQRKREKRLKQQQEPDKVNKQEQATRTQTLLDGILGS